MRDIRISIASITFILLMFGVVMVYSSSAIYAFENYRDSLFFLKSHLFSFVIGFILTILVMSIDCDRIKENSKGILFFSILFLILVLLPGVGKSVSGARRWIALGFFHFQPSEIAKLGFLIYIAGFLGRKQNRIKDFLTGYLPPMVMLGAIVFLVLLQPDLGTAFLIGVIGVLVLFVSGAKSSHILPTMLASLPFLYYFIFKIPYRKMRLIAFMNPWSYEKDIGFQLVQSLLALGSGGLFGVGLGQSKQKLFFLPASHTDFIFSIIGEELGFIGTFSVMMLFFVLIWQGMKAGFRVHDIFKKTLIFGIVFTIAFEVIINTSVTTGLVPTKGLPLPFISFGGTSLITHMLAIGLLLNATRE